MSLTPGTRIGAYVVADDGWLVARYTPTQREVMGLLPEGVAAWAEPNDLPDPELIGLINEVPLGAPIGANRRRTSEAGMEE